MSESTVQDVCDEKVIVFSPHFDDAVIGCGGTIVKKISEGFEVLIVVMVDSTYSNNVKRAAKILGVPIKNLIFLHFRDRMLKSNEREARLKIIEILKKNPPVETYITYYKDAHPDHRATNRIVNNAIKELGLQIPRYQYSILQTCARIGPILNLFLDRFKHSVIYIDISKYLHLKAEALKTLKSEPFIIKRHLKTKEVFIKINEDRT
jgi:LmbE family N-acetylglucosaminyl deacetylase